jgi:aminobutyraldehyde dehydrogenase
VVFKPSEQTPLTALKTGARIWPRCCPKAWSTSSPGRGQTVGNHLINHPGIDMISLTGDVATGKKMLDAAAKTVKRTHLELGGKAPVIVFDDADLAAVVEGLRAFSFYNAGQDCTAACRVYAGRKIYDNLVADLTSAAASITLGAEDDTTNEIGPLISQRQRDRVASFVNRARELNHVEVTTGGEAMDRASTTAHRGRRRPQEDEIVRREVFGPVVSVTPFDDVDQASPGPTTATMAWPPRSGRATSAAQWPRPRACATAAPGSTRISCW